MDSAPDELVAQWDREHAELWRAIFAANSDADVERHVIERGITLSYDQESDILDLTIGQPREALTESLDNTTFLRVIPSTLEIVGWGVLGYQSFVNDPPQGLERVAELVRLMGERVMDGSITISGSDATEIAHSMRELVPA